MRAGEIIVGLDVGTTKVCTLVAETTERGLNLLGIGSSESKGLRKGIVVDIESTVDSIRDSLREAEKLSGVKISSAFVGIAGGHIKSFSSYGAVGIRDGEVTDEDIEKALEAAKAVYVPLDREVLHVIPQEYIVDGEDGIMNPVGMSGVRLESRVQIVTGSVSAVQNLLRCCEKAGVQVSDIVLEPLASSIATLSEDEKKEGTVLIDIGGGTTDIALYKRGVLLHTAVIAIGGNHITNDIAIGLRLPVHEAERVKMKYGTVLQRSEGDDMARVMVAGRDEKLIPRSYITEIIYPRCEELLGIIRTELEDSGAYDQVSYGVVLTGGASQLEGLTTLGEAMLGMPVRIGLPGGFDGPPGLATDPRYATGVGLLLYGMERSMEGGISAEVFTSILSKMKEWVKGFLRRKTLKGLIFQEGGLHEFRH
ncbi:MAG: cell division protein FtsA [Nitrospirae bacterium]|nr:MAG: cell division protein FtsA [Nitrospirota bacterium]